MDCKNLKRELSNIDTNMLNGMSMDWENANMEKLKSVFPDCFSDRKLM